ncbi:OmpA family protein [Lysobacter spongiae]|uniref:OmpA family protein n=2 Tax=Marilutibacter spongiae TaxID=2025720 RepID=A0A7W3TKH5_9GAMM|nr:OmpA family protein [Lysobacter spongiae]
MALATLALTACGGADRPDDAEASTGPDRMAAARADDAAPADTDADGGAAAAQAGFDVESVPVSDAPLGEFPYFNLPAGYGNPNSPKPILDLDRVPFWTGDRLEWVEGRAFQSLIRAERGKNFSQFELKKNIEHLITSVGGVKVTDSRIPQSALDTLDDSYEVAYSAGHGDIYNNPVQTYLVRRADRNIWVHVCSDTASAGWIIVESQPFQATASLIEVDAMKQALDADGRVALQVNFATDKADILPESRPQLDQVIALLQDDPALALSIEGHTDDTGGADHNMALSDARANAVVQALVDAGISRDRLQAEGFGQTRPVADNGSEDGRAQNRRVELVKR